MRVGPTLRYLAVLMALGPVAMAHAQSRVGIFAVRTPPSESPAVNAAARAAAGELARDGRPPHTVAPMPDGDRSPASFDPVRTWASTAFAESSRGKNSREMLAAYQSDIDAALAQVPFTHDNASRNLLWNVCILRAQLISRSQGDFDTDPAREAVQHCRRLFIDPHPFNPAWPPGLVDAFERHDAALPKVQLRVRSEKSQCDVRINGALFGKTPLGLSVATGLNYVQVACGARRSQVYPVEITGERTVMIPLAADGALLPDEDGITWLSYPKEHSFEPAHAHALAELADLSAHVVVQPSGSGAQVTLWRDESAVGSMEVTADDPDLAGKLRELLGLKAPAWSPLGAQAARGGQAEAPPAGPPPRRVAGDYVLGASLALAGAALMAHPLLALAKAGDCANPDCTERYREPIPAAGALFGAGFAVTAFGGWVIAWGPFGAAKQRAYTLQAGLQSVAVTGRF